MSLSIEKFRKLPRVERERRYNELSDHDKFVARMEDWGAPESSGISTKAFLANPPKGWEGLTEEILHEMFPTERDT